MISTDVQFNSQPVWWDWEAAIGPDKPSACPGGGGTGETAYPTPERRSVGEEELSGELPPGGARKRRKQVLSGPAAVGGDSTGELRLE